ncbi:MAG: CDP-glycerol glycerophosphotransferase family protein [Chloroflexota bacterium]|nr:CDP-glycerol glycerophosphotransferase family protein [Chloroflexota bacterium]
MKNVVSFIAQWKNSFNFHSLPKNGKSIVFYSEGKPSSPHLGPLIQQLINRGHNVQLLMSDKDDPLAELKAPDAKVISHWIGSGSARIWVYSNLKSCVFITTTPDLDTMQLKRSKSDAYYVYTHHSMISTHMGYRPGAFDHFDAILCTGRYQVEETRDHESRSKLPAKKLAEVGYFRLDELRSSAIIPVHNEAPGTQQDITSVLLAPTWGENSILPLYGEEIIDILLQSGYRVITRPHPETTRRSPQLIRKISDRFSAHNYFELDVDPRGDLWMQQTNLMISDWSGVAMEYAYGFEKPVLFIDLPRKINNPRYAESKIEPIEVSVRNEIGKVVHPKNISELPSEITNILSKNSGLIKDIRSSRAKHVFNQGRSARIAANFIEEMIDTRS